MRDSLKYKLNDIFDGIILYVLGISGLILLFGLIFIVLAACINIYYGLNL